MEKERRCGYVPLSANFWPDTVTKPVDAGGAGVEELTAELDVDVAVCEVDALLTVVGAADVDAAAPGRHCE